MAAYRWFIASLALLCLLNWSSAIAEPIYFTRNTGNVARIESDGTGLTTLVTINSTQGITIDSTNSKIYFYSSHASPA